MKDEQTAKALRSLIEAMRQHSADSVVGRLLDNHLPGGLDEVACNWLIQQARRATAELVFSFEVPGFVLVGQGDLVGTFGDPDLMGLRAAHEVFMHGPNAPYVLRADAPNRLRNALRRAAEWAETEGQCERLAAAIRSIKVRNDGSPVFQPLRPIYIKLGGVFSACSDVTHRS